MADNRWFVRFTLRLGLVLLGLTPAVAAAQAPTTISGRVTASVGGTPLYGAIVSTPTLRVSASTNGDGRYQLVVPAASTGAATLTARLIGFKTQSVQVSLTGADVTQDIALEEGAIELTGKVVTALGIEREPGSLSYAAQTLSGEDRKSAC